MLVYALAGDVLGHKDYRTWLDQQFRNAYHAAIAIEHNADFVTTDGDFARFPGLRWHHPLRS